MPISFHFLHSVSIILLFDWCGVQITNRGPHILTCTLILFIIIYLFLYRYSNFVIYFVREKKYFDVLYGVLTVKKIWNLVSECYKCLRYSWRLTIIVNGKILGFHGGKYEDDCLLGCVTYCGRSLLTFGGVYCTNISVSSKCPWNVSKLLDDYTAQHPTRQPSS